MLLLVNPFRSLVVSFQHIDIVFRPPVGSFRVIVPGLRSPEDVLRSPADNLRTPEGFFRIPEPSFRPPVDAFRRWKLLTLYVTFSKLKSALITSFGI